MDPMNTYGSTWLLIRKSAPHFTCTRSGSEVIVSGQAAPRREGRPG